MKTLRDSTRFSLGNSLALIIRQMEIWSAVNAVKVFTLPGHSIDGPVKIAKTSLRREMMLHHSVVTTIIAVL